MGRWIGMSDRHAASTLHHELDRRQDHADGLEGQEVADDGQLREERRKYGHVEGPREVLQALEGRIQQLVSRSGAPRVGLAAA